MPLSNVNTTWDEQKLLQKVTQLLGANVNYPTPTSYEEARDTLIKVLENATLYKSVLTGSAAVFNGQQVDRIHNDSADLPTIGYGFNLGREDLLPDEVDDVFLAAFGTLDADQTTAVELIRVWKTSRFGNIPTETLDLVVNGQTHSFVLNGLDIIAGAQGLSVSAHRAGLTPDILQAFDEALTPLSSIVLGEAAANALLDVDMTGLAGVIDGREDKLSDQFADGALPDSIERVAIMSAFYNAESLVGLGLEAAIDADKRATAWWELRYNNAPNPVAQPRRVFETDLFRLISKSGEDTHDVKEYKTALGSLFDGQSERGVNMYEHIANRPDHGTPALLKAIERELNFLESVYALPQGTGSAVDVDMVQTDLESIGGTIEGKTATGKTDATTVNLIFGEGGNDTLRGKGSNDFLFGGEPVSQPPLQTPPTACMNMEY